jgi:hypothetical protein
MDLRISRRRVLEAGVVVQGAGMPVLANAVTHPADDLKRLGDSFVNELEQRLGLTPWNAQAMLARAMRLVDRPAALMLGDSHRETVEIVQSERHRRPWRVRGEPGCDLSLFNAVGLATRYPAASATTGAASMRWVSSCTFGGASGHVLRQPRGTVFLVTQGACDIAPRRVDFG